MNTPDICIYHGYCPDGFTSAWAVWKRFGDSVEYRHGSYGSAPPTPDGKHILLVDFSYKRPVLEEMAKKAASITILDHHKTSRDDLEPLLASGMVQGIFDMERSGAGLTWDVLHPDSMRPMLINIVEDRDLWRWRYGDHTRFLCKYIDTYEMTFENWDKLAYEFQTDNSSALKIGSALYHQHLKNANSMIAATMQRATIGGFDVPLCNVPHLYSSETGNILARRDDAPFGATFYIDKDGSRIFSLRSLDEKQDVSEIALKYGGGGHRNASGFRLLPGETLW